MFFLIIWKSYSKQDNQHKTLLRDSSKSPQASELDLSKFDKISKKLKLTNEQDIYDVQLILTTLLMILSFFNNLEEISKKKG